LALVRAHWRIENNCFGRLDIEWQEDHGRWVHRGNGLPVVSILRIVAYNLLQMLHAVHLRSEAARRAAWQQLRDWVRDVLEGCPTLPMSVPPRPNLARFPFLVANSCFFKVIPTGERGHCAFLTHPNRSEFRGGLPPRTSGRPWGGLL